MFASPVCSVSERNQKRDDRAERQKKREKTERKNEMLCRSCLYLQFALFQFSLSPVLHTSYSPRNRRHRRHHRRHRDHRCCHRLRRRRILDASPWGQDNYPGGWIAEKCSLHLASLSLAVLLYLFLPLLYLSVSLLTKLSAILEYFCLSVYPSLSVCL